MVTHLSPDRPKECLEDDHIVEDDDIDIEEEQAALNSYGYQLIPLDLYSNEATYDSDDSGSSDQTNEEGSDNECASPDSGFNNELNDVQMNVNFDEVRAAMRNVTLPPSAMPAWAASVPEAQWTSFLISRIRSIQNNSQET